MYEVTKNLARFLRPLAGNPKPYQKHSRLFVEQSKIIKLEEKGMHDLL